MCHYQFEQPHKKDKYIIRSACIIGGIALLFLCVGLSLPTWYVGYSPNTQLIVATANYFYTCHAVTDEATTELRCVSYSSYLCDQIIPVGCQNATRLGCINSASSAKLYRYLDAPITYISLEDLERLRASGGTAIVGIVFLALSIIVTLPLSFCDFPLIFLYVSLVLLSISDIFLVVSLVSGSLVIRYYHVGCSLFVTGTMITFLFTIIGAFAVGRLEARKTRIDAEQRADNYEIAQTNGNT